MIKDYSDRERGNPLLPHGLLFPIMQQGLFYMHHPTCQTSRGALAGTRNSSIGGVEWVEYSAATELLKFKLYLFLKCVCYVWAYYVVFFVVFFWGGRWGFLLWVYAFSAIRLCHDPPMTSRRPH